MNLKRPLKMVLKMKTINKPNQNFKCMNIIQQNLEKSMYLYYRTVVYYFLWHTHTQIYSKYKIKHRYSVQYDDKTYLDT